MQCNAPSLSWLADPQVFAVNRLPAHSDHSWTVGGKALRQSLDGVWRFAYSPDHAHRPAQFWQPEADLAAFGEIRVPGHIETQGYGQLQYVNVQYPWDGVSALRPPQIDPADAPVGSYVRDFVPDPALAGRRVCVSFQGVEQAFYLWCNGRFVGYSEDSFTPADFELTGFLRPGVNRLCVEVHKRCAASWIEDQDMFRFSGIFRPVFLYAKPDLHIEDLWLRAGLTADNAAGTLAPRVRLSAAAGASLDGCTLRCTVAAPGGAVVYDAPLPLQPEGDYLAVPADAPLHIAGVRPWRHGDPALYQVTLTLCDAAGREAETVRYPTGFRRVEINAEGVLCLNGERVVFHGVNRHEWNPETGRAIGPADMYSAIECFRRNHINAVRTCHYPDQTLWYELCDQNGIYMIDEANLESHGCWQRAAEGDPDWEVPGSSPLWRDCVVDRARAMFERDKNHTAVLLWSCGNESLAGDNILAMAEFLRANDPGRPVHYEGVGAARQFGRWDPAWARSTDVESRMYARPWDIRAHLQDASQPPRPFLLCEYMHDMGNSLGGMESYARLEQEFARYQGGFIWDYMDQALWRTDACGRRTLGYGGDFGDRPSDYAFCADGLLFADGTEKPAMQEVRYWYADAAKRAEHDAARDAAQGESARALAAEADARAAAAALAPDLRVVQGSENLGVQGPGFAVLFSAVQGGPVSLRSGGAQWLYRAPRPAFWRAATENDTGSGFARRSAAWLAAEAQPQLTGWTLEECGPRRVRVVYRFGCAALPGAQAELRYTVEAGGTLTLQAAYHGAPGLPQLPCFGVHLVTPAPLAQVAWTGLSGETYPDRWKGAHFGRWQQAPALPGYLVPQDCGCHVGTHSLTLRSAAGQTTALVMDGQPFAFSALPYSALELEAADHREALAPPLHTHLCLYAAMRGVGGIDSWGADVEQAYHVSAEADHCLTVRWQL